MSILHTWAKSWRSTVGPLILAFAVAMVIGGIAPKPAFSQVHERHSWRQERGRQAREWRRENRREWREAHRWRGRAPYGYYAPPPGVYAPAPSPGINLFFHIP
jgi:hypothetical protein